MVDVLAEQMLDFRMISQLQASLTILMEQQQLVFVKRLYPISQISILSPSFNQYSSETIFRPTRVQLVALIVLTRLFARTTLSLMLRMRTKREMAVQRWIRLTVLLTLTTLSLFSWLRNLFAYTPILITASFTPKALQCSMRDYFRSIGDGWDQDNSDMSSNKNHSRQMVKMRMAAMENSVLAGYWQSVSDLLFFLWRVARNSWSRGLRRFLVTMLRRTAKLKPIFKEDNNIIMLYARVAQPCRLLHRTLSPLFIYLRDHNQHINPEQSRLNLSYAHPNNLVPQGPKHKFINFKLDPEMEMLMERQVFEEYKNKVLRGIVDEVEAKEADPLWGEEPVPIHYFSRLSKTNLMTVSHPQRADIENSLNQIYSAYFIPSYEGEVTKEAVASAAIEQIPEMSLKARQEDISDGTVWFAIEERLERGHKLHLLTPQQLIKLKFSFEGHRKQGTPLFHEILSSLIREDVPHLPVNDLIHLFIACRYSNGGQTNLQLDVLEALKSHLSQLGFEEKVNFLLAFTLYTKPIKFHKKVERRRKNEFKELANKVLFRLNFWQLELNDQLVTKLIFSLAKLRLDNTKFITLPLLHYVKQHFDTFTADKTALFHAAVYLPELENGEGVGDQDFMARLKEAALAKWGEFGKVEQMRLVHSFWNYGLMDQTLLEHYKGIELQADSTLLYYASQIELNTSSEREWLIIQLSVLLEYIPLPYYSAFKRFHNYIKTTTEWNLTPLEDKLKNTEYYYNVMRLYNSIAEVKPYKGLRGFEKFSGLRFAAIGCPIENLQLSHFAFPVHQVSLDIVSKKDYIPGTTQFKESYMNKVRSLRSLGWKHLAFDEGEVRALPLAAFIKNVQESYLPYVEEQQKVIEYAEYQRAEQVEEIKMVRTMAEFDVKLLNHVFFEGPQEEEEEEIDPFTGKKKPSLSMAEQTA